MLNISFGYSPQTLVSKIAYRNYISDKGFTDSGQLVYNRNLQLVYKLFKIKIRSYLRNLENQTTDEEDNMFSEPPLKPRSDLKLCNF